MCARGKKHQTLGIEGPLAYNHLIQTVLSFRPYLAWHKSNSKDGVDGGCGPQAPIKTTSHGSINENGRVRHAQQCCLLVIHGRQRCDAVLSACCPLLGTCLGCVLV